MPQVKTVQRAGKQAGGEGAIGTLRFQLLCGVIGLGLLGGMMISWRLWFSAGRTFPRTPFITVLPTLPEAFVEYLLSGALVIALLLLIIPRLNRILSGAAILLLVLLILLDQTRLQPWVYQYLLMLAVLFGVDWRRGEDLSSQATALDLLRLLSAGLYFWSGVQKLNFTFIVEVVPKLFPVEFLPAFLPVWTIGIGVGLTEILIAVCLLSASRARKIGVVLAAATHLIIIAVLVARNYNSVVWVWNIVLIILAWLLFWREPDFSWRIIFNQREKRSRIVQGIVAASLILPVLSFWGWWDMYLSGALYSGNTSLAAMRVSDDVLPKLPPTAQAIVFRGANGDAAVPFAEWALNDLNVPPYVEPRVYKQIGREICRLAEDPAGVELILKERPAVLTGEYQVKRLSCFELSR